MNWRTICNASNGRIGSKGEDELRAEKGGRKLKGDGEGCDSDDGREG